MSNTVDERVVEMRFDNAQFEKNVQTSMSTLEKLKKSLNFSQSTKSLEELDSAVNSVDFSSMEKSLESIEKRFSTVGIAIMRYKQKLIDASVSFVKSGIISGGTRRATNLENAQFQLQGLLKDADKVSAVMKNVNDAVDGTAYSLDAAANVASQLAASGMEAGDQMFHSLRAVAGVAAMTNSSYEDIGRIFTQVAGQGRMMGDQLLQLSGRGMNAAATLATYLGKTESEVRDMVSKGEISFEIFSNAMDDAFGEHAKKANETLNGALSNMKSALARIGAEFVSPLIKSNGPLVQLFNTIRERINEIKKNIGPVVDVAVGIATSAINKLTSLVKNLNIQKFFNLFNWAGSLFSKNIEKANKFIDPLRESLGSVIKPATQTFQTIEKVTSAVEDLGSIVDNVIIGKFGNGQERFNALSEQGINFYRVQNKVNETLGNSFRYTQEQIDAQDALLGVQIETVEVTGDAVDANAELTDVQKERLKELVKLNSVELRQLGYTGDQIRALNELKNTAGRLGIPIDRFIDQMDQINARWMVLEGIKNIGRAISKVFSSMSKAFKEVFKPLQANTLVNAVVYFQKFTSVLILSDENADKLRRTFKGLFAALDIVKTLTGGALSVAFKVLCKIMGNANMNILDFTSRIGDAIVKLRDFLYNNKLVNGAINLLVKGIEAVAKIIGNVINAILNNPLTDKIAEIWDNLFGSDVDGNAKGVISLIENLGNAMGISETKGTNLKSVMDGINSALNISNWKWSASLTSSLKLLDAVLGLFGTNLANVGATIADYVTVFGKWLREHTIFVGMSDKIAASLKTLIEGITKCVHAFMQLPAVQKIVQNFKNMLTKLFGDMSKGFDSVNIEGFCNKIEKAFNNIEKWIKGLKDSEHLGRDIVAGIVNGLLGGVKTSIDAIVTIGTTIMDTFCELLGIHSPSRWGYDQGMNIVKGIVNGIKAGVLLIRDSILYIGNEIKDSFKDLEVGDKLDDIMDKIKMTITTFADFVKNFNFKYLLTLIPVSIVLVAVKKLYDMTKVIEGGIKSVNSVISAFAEVGNSLADTISAYKHQIQAKALRNLAISIGILVGAVVALTYVDPDRLDDAVATVVVLAGVMAALALAMSKMETASVTLERSNVSISGLKSGLIAIGASILMLAASIKLIGSMNIDQYKQGLAGLTLIVLAMGTLLTAIGAIGKFGDLSSVDKVGSFMLKLSVSLLLMSKVIKLIGGLSEEEVLKGTVFLGAFTVFISTLSVLSRFAGKEISSVGGLMLKISIALALMVGAVKLIGLLSAEEMLKGAVFIAGFTGFVSGLVLVTNMFPNGRIQKISGLVMSLSVSMMLLVGVCKLAAMLSPDEMKKGALFATGVLVFIGVLVQVTKIASTEKVAKVSATILAMSVAVGVLAGISILMGLVDTEALIKGVAAVTALGAIMTAMIWATRGSEDVKKNIVAMSVAIGVMAGAVALLCLIKPQRLAGSTAALVSLMASFALMEKMAGDAQGAWKTIGMLTLVVAAMAGILTAMSKLKVTSTLQNAESLSVLLLAMSASLKVLSTIDRVEKDALIGMTVLTAVVAGLGVIFGIMNHYNINPSIETATSLSVLLVAMAGVTAILGTLGPASYMAMAGAIGMVGVVTVIGSFIGILGALNEKFPQIKRFLNEGIPVLKAIGDGIGAFIGGIISGIAGGILDTLPKIGTALSDFMDNLSGFLEKVVNVDSNALSGAGYLAGAIIALSAAEFINGITSFLPFGGDLALLGTNLSKFINNAEDFLKGISGVDSDTANAAKALAQAILALTASELITRITNFLKFGGNGELDDFATRITAFGEAIAKFSKAVSGDNAIDSEAVTSAANAGKLLAELEKTLPKTDGLLPSIVGTEDISKFGEKCEVFGESITKFSNSVDEGAIDSEAVELAVSAGKLLSELENTLSKSGGLWQDIVGTEDISDFGEKCIQFGEAISDFSKSVSGDNAINENAVESAAKAGNMMAELQEAIPDKKLFDGKVELSTFGNQISLFGSGLSSFAMSISGIEFSNVETAITQSNRLKNLAKDVVDLDVDEIVKFNSVTAIATTIKTFSDTVKDISTDIISDSISSAYRLKALVIGLGELDTRGIDNFNVEGIGTSLNGYYSKVSGINQTTLLASIVSANALADLIYKLSGIDSNGVTAFTSSLNTLSTVDIENFVTSFTDAGMRTSKAFSDMLTEISFTINNKRTVFSKAGEELMTYFTNGLESSSVRARIVILLLMNTYSNAIRSYYDSFNSAGKYLGDGLIEGINAKKKEVYDAGYALGKKAVEGEKDGQQSKSPSKLTKKAGRWLGEGLIIGMEQMGNAVYQSGKLMGTNAVESISGALSSISDISATDLDMTPTIQPVVNMADIQNGVRTLQVGADVSTRLLSAPIDSLQKIVSDAQANINASNNDVIQAINDLRADLNAMYSGDDTELALYVDSKKLASTIAKPMNRQLLTLQKRGSH